MEFLGTYCVYLHVCKHVQMYVLNELSCLFTLASQ